MKKKLTAIISLLIAVVMSFALIACDNGDNGDNGNSAPPVLSSAIAKLKSADGYKGGIKFLASTEKHKNAVDFEGAIEKRGSKFKATAGEGNAAEQYIFDLKTGYLYSDTQNGYYFETLLPAGTIDYAQFMIGKMLENANVESIDDLFEYDATTHTSTFSCDGVQTANAFLAPIISAYKNNSNAVTLINNYLKLASPDPTRPYTLDGVLDMAVTFVASQPEVTLGAMIQAASAYGIDVYGLLEKSGVLAKFGITLDAATKQKIEARKVAEFVTALNEVAAEIKNNPQLAQDIPAILDRLFVRDVTVTDLRASLNSIKNMIVAVLTLQEVKPLVDKYLGGMTPAYLRELYAVIVNGVEIEKFDLTVSVKFDDKYNITGIAASGNFAHDYQGDATGYYVLSDNNYKFDVKLDISEYLTAPSTFDMTFAENAGAANITSVISLVYGNYGNEVSVYFETGGKEIVPTISAETPYMSYDAQTTSFKFDMRAVKEAYSEEIQSGTFDGFDGIATFGENQTVMIFVNIMPETPQGLIKMLGGLLDRIPSVPEQGGDITDNIQP